MSVDTVEKIFDLELEILRQGDGMSADDAYNFHGMLTSSYADFMEAQCYYFGGFPEVMNDHDEKSLHSWVDIGECVQKKVTRLQKLLKGFFQPPESIPQIESNTDSLKLLFRKQKFYVQMIDSLAPSEDELSPKEAELQYEHVSQYYEKFVANQSEIMTLVGDDVFDDQVNLSKKIHRKVFSFQKSLKEILSPSKQTVLWESKVNEHFNRTDRPNVIVDFLDSLIKKQKSLIEQIESIESKNDLSTAEAETLHSHLSQLHGSFIRNQTKIESYVGGSTLDKELELSREILEKVMSLQTKLKKIFAPVVSTSLAEPKPIDVFPDFLHSFFENQKQKSLKNNTKSMKR